MAYLPLPVCRSKIYACTPCCALQAKMVSADGFRNIAVVAHVDHGKTTLVDALFATSLGDKAGEKMGGKRQRV